MRFRRRWKASRAISRKLRVCVLTGGGFGLVRYGLTFVRYLAELKIIDVWLCVNRRDAVTAERFCAELATEARIVRLNGTSGFQKPFSFFRVLAGVASVKPDVVHDSIGPSSRITWLLWVLMKPFYRLIVTVHDPVPHSGIRNGFLKFRTRLCGALADVVVVHGQDTMGQAVRAGIPADKIKVVPHPELAVYKELATRRGCRRIKEICDDGYVLWFGAIRPNKGVELLSSIFNLSWELDSRVRFVVAGKRPNAGLVQEASWNNDIDRLASIANTRNNLVWLDRFIDDDEVFQLFVGARVVILPYRDASQSGVLMTAVGLGIPVICCPVGDIPSVVRNGINGYLVQYESEEFARTIVRVWNDDDERQRLANGMEQVKSELFSLRQRRIWAQELYLDGIVR